MIFEDRKHAGLLLAKALEKYRGKNLIIFALPRGGVEVGTEIASRLNMPLNIIVARKIGSFENPEYAIAAISESGFLAENEKETARVDQKWLEKALETGRREAERRRLLYSSENLPKNLEGKTAIIVDDGLATGLTVKAAIKELKSLSPDKLVVAVPVAPAEAAEELKKLVDEVVVINSDKNFLGAVGNYYQDFPQLSDDEVLILLNRD